MNTQQAAGKYYWRGLFNPYKNLPEDHVARGMAEVTWNEDTQKYEVYVITTVFPAKLPDRLVNAIIFHGVFETKKSAQIKEGDLLKLNHIKRIGVGYSETTSKQLLDPSATSFSYSYPVTKVILDNGDVSSIELMLDVGVTKGPIIFERAV